MEAGAHKYLAVACLQKETYLAVIQAIRDKEIMDLTIIISMA